MSKRPSDIFAWFQAWGQAHPTRAVLQWRLGAQDKKGFRTWTYQALADETQRLLTLFAGLGHQGNAVLTLALPIVPTALSSLMAAHRLGPVLIVDPMAAPDHIAAAMQRHQSTTLVTVGPYPDLDIWARMERLRPMVPTLQHVLQLDLTGFLGRWQRLTARSSLRRYGKAEPIPGQQIGDLLATAAKLSPIEIGPASMPYPLYGLGLDGQEQPWEPISYPDIFPSTVPDLRFGLWGQCLRDRETLQREMLLAWAQGLIPRALGPLGWQGLGFWEQVEEFDWATFSLPREEAHHFEGLTSPLAYGSIPEDLATLTVGGERVSVASVEACLRRHPMLEQAAVVGGPDPKLGQIPVAFVQSAHTAPLDLAAIYAYCQAQLPALACPRAFRVLDRLPRRLDGSLDRQPLAAQEQGQ